jgi:outer membrane protein assembly factor BamB
MIMAGNDGFRFPGQCAAPLLTVLLTLASLISPACAFGREPAQGLCVQLGGGTLEESLESAKQYFIHRLDHDEPRVRRWRKQLVDGGHYGAITIEHWTNTQLPYVDNLANLVVVASDFEVDASEVERITAPGGVVIYRLEEGEREWRKPVPAAVDEWTHQWHGPSGSVTSRDRTIGVPTGIQWLQGPLFAMANRKSSTQSLVSAGGRNFYVTQNVVENLSLPDDVIKPQFLVARDAYNGLMLWKRPWLGPSVTGDGETNARLVADAERLWLVTEHGLMTLAAASGETLWEHDLPTPATKLARLDGRLIAEFESGIQCYEEGELLWAFRDTNLHGTVGSGGRLFTLVVGRNRDGSFKNHLVCLDVQSGELQWRIDTQPWTETRHLQISFAQDNYVGLQAHGHFHVFSADDGRHLWSRATDARPGKDYVDERFVGHLYQNGLIWLLAENSVRQSDGQNVWLALNPKTGELQRRLETVGLWPRTATPAKMGCQLIMATDRYIMIPRQATFIDFETGDKLDFKFIRGGCGLGFVPANGLVYSHPHACGCFSEAIRGFLAAHSRLPPTDDDVAASGPRLVTGSGQVSSGDEVLEPTGEDWPMYRRDYHRSAMTNSQISTTPAVLWKVDVASASRHVENEEWQLRVGSRISAPVVSGGLAYVADIEGHQVVAMDVATGAVRWRFTAGGRVDSPPTLHQGLCLFGSHDGYVYCVSAMEGNLIWRFRAAPVDRRISAYGQIESAWPVAGSVLIQADTAFVAAGRAPDADGGITISALDPESGELRWSRSVSDDMVGLGEMLVGDGEHVYLANWRFDPSDGSGTAVAEKAARHLRGGKMGLLESSWTRIDLALRKAMHDWTARGTAGQLLTFSEQDVVGFRISESGEGAIFSSARGWSRGIEHPRRVHALVGAGDHLILAGGEGTGASSGFLALHSSKTGEPQFETALTSLPVFDGVAVAHGRIFVTLQSGQVSCLGSNP